MKGLDQTRWLNTPWHHLTRAQMAMRSAPRCVTRQGLQLCKRIFIIVLRLFYIFIVVLRLFLMLSTVTFWPSHKVSTDSLGQLWSKVNESLLPLSLLLPIPFTWQFSFDCHCHSDDCNFHLWAILRSMSFDVHPRHILG